jgi:geranylgeranyl pyrophosphate synthase
MRREWTATQWRDLRSIVERAGGFEYARARAMTLADDARAMLESEPAGPARRALDQAIDYAVQRDH